MSAESAEHALLHPVREESRSLDRGIRARMERSFEAAFGDVVIHAGAASADLAESLDAAAFTVGRHVVFGPGRFDPSSVRGRLLLAHELGHVVEQRHGGGDLDLGERLPAAAIPLHHGHSPGAQRTEALAALGHSAGLYGSSAVGIARQSKQESAMPVAATITKALRQRQDGAPTTARALQLAPGDSLAATRAVMQAIEDLTLMQDGRYMTTYQGQTLVMTAEDAERARASARKALTNVVAKSRRRFDTAVARYEGQEAVDEEFGLASTAAHAAAWIGSLGGHRDPGMALALQRPVIELAEHAVERDTAAGQMVAAAEVAARSEIAARRSADLVRVYIDQTIEGAEGMVSGLENTRDAAFVTLGVLAVVATGGAAAGLAPEVIGAGVGGLSVGATTTAISVGAPIIASVGVGFAKLVEGDPVDWGDIAVDAAVQIVLAKFGGKLGERVFGRLVGNPASATVMRRALASVGSGVISHEYSQAFTAVVDETYAALRGRPASWSHFVDELAKRISDPQGIFIAAAMSGFQFAAHEAIAKASTPPGATQRSTPDATARPGPAAQEPAIVSPAPSSKSKSTSAPGAAKAAKVARPSDLKRKAEAGERMRIRAEERVAETTAKELSASTRAAAAKDRLRSAKAAVEARQQAGGKSTKAQQAAVERAQRQVSRSESSHATAKKASQSARTRLQEAQEVAETRSAAHTQTKTTSKTSSASGTKDAPRYRPGKDGPYNPKTFRRPRLRDVKVAPGPVDRVGPDGLRTNPNARVSVFHDPLGKRVAPIKPGSKQKQGYDYERQLREDLAGGAKYRETHTAGDKTRHGDIGSYEVKYKGKLTSDDLDQIWRDLNNPSRGHSALIITPKAHESDLRTLAKMAAAFEKVTGQRPRIAVRETDPRRGGAR
ncbi:eCIS core domain-containing protein [Kribbella sp. NPDC055110]